MDKVFFGNIERLTLDNDNYRKVIHTTPDNNMQLVLMSLNPNEEIGMEIHEHTDQFFRIDKGNGTLIYLDNDKEIKTIFSDGDSFIIPAGTHHNVINTGKEQLKLYTIYTPKNHPNDRLQRYKSDDDEHH